jgi:hypothetical protein
MRRGPSAAGPPAWGARGLARRRGNGRSALQPRDAAHPPAARLGRALGRPSHAVRAPASTRVGRPLWAASGR